MCRRPISRHRLRREGPEDAREDRARGAPRGRPSAPLRPPDLRADVERLIEREIEHRRSGRGGHLIFKLTALVDRRMIECLYRVSQAGVRCELLVRGICCLRPGVPGISDLIEVTGIVGRFLEHSRACWFANGGREECYLGGARQRQRPTHAARWRVRTGAAAAGGTTGGQPGRLHPAGPHGRRRCGKGAVEKGPTPMSDALPSVVEDAVPSVIEMDVGVTTRIWGYTAGAWAARLGPPPAGRKLRR